MENYVKELFTVSTQVLVHFPQTKTMSWHVWVESVSWYNSVHYQFPTAIFAFTKVILMYIDFSSFGLVWLPEKSFLAYYAYLFATSKYVSVILLALGYVLFIEIPQQLALFKV